MHPAMPFITEALWCNLTGKETLVTASWPEANASHVDENASANVVRIQEIITEIRRFRNDQGIKGSAKILARFANLGSLSSYEAAIRFIVRCDAPNAGGEDEGNFASKIEVGPVTIEFDLSGAIDVNAERARLTKDLAQAEKDRATAKVKLDNEGFMAKAPLEVVTEIRERLAQTTADIERMTAALAALPAK